MARRLCAFPNLLVLEDRLSGGSLGLYYRMPTTKERVAYANGQVVREKGKIVDRTVETRIRFGLRILSGVRTGDFEVPDGAGGWSVVSSNPQEVGYREDWKEIVEKYAADCIAQLAFAVFERSVRDQAEEPEPPAKDDLDDDLDGDLGDAPVESGPTGDADTD